MSRFLRPLLMLPLHWVSDKRFVPRKRGNPSRLIFRGRTFPRCLAEEVPRSAVIVRQQSCFVLYKTRTGEAFLHGPQKKSIRKVASLVSFRRPTPKPHCLAEARNIRSISIVSQPDSVFSLFIALYHDTVPEVWSTYSSRFSCPALFLGSTLVRSPKMVGLERSEQYFSSELPTRQDIHDALLTALAEGSQKEVAKYMRSTAPFSEQKGPCARRAACHILHLVNSQEHSNKLSREVSCIVLCWMCSRGWQLHREPQIRHTPLNTLAHPEGCFPKDSAPK